MKLLKDHLKIIPNNVIITKTFGVITLSNLINTIKFQKNFKKLVFKVHKVFLIFFKESIIGAKLILALILLVNEEDLLKKDLNIQEKFWIKQGNPELKKKNTKTPQQYAQKNIYKLISFPFSYTPIYTPMLKDYKQ